MSKRQPHNTIPSIPIKRKRKSAPAKAPDVATKKATKSDAVARNNNNNFVLGRCDSVLERYEKMGRRLGQGTYGVVYQARDRVSGRYVALKRCIPHHQESDGFPLTTLREIQSLRLCSGHENVVQLENVAVSKSGVFLVFEYCAVDFLHARHMIHRDIKMSNLLYTESGILKLADFGLSRPYADSLQSQLTPQVASLWYRPPELLLGAASYNTAIDMWAVGCIAGEIATGQPLMNGSSEMDQIQKVFDCIGLSGTKSEFFSSLPLIRNGKISLPRKSPRKLLDMLGNKFTQKGLALVHSLLQLDPTHRWTASQALKSVYFDELPLPTPTNKMPRFPRSFQN